MSKRRFGVSVSRGVAESLDAIANSLGVDRSSLVEIALRGLLEDFTHHIVPHNCVALIVNVCDKDPEEALSLMESYRELGVTQLHSHTGEKCLQILLVTGPNSVISDLYSKLSKLKGCRSKYIPLHDIGDIGGSGVSTRSS
mgnify:CR=1 FL=1